MANLTTGVVAIDNGGHSTILVTRNAEENFPSVKGLYNNGNLTAIKGKYDFIVEYKGKKYVAGDLAKYDCEMPLQMFTKTKQNEFYDLSVLIGVHQFGYLSNYVVVSVPIKQYTPEEGEGITKRLKTSHTITINGVTKTFSISDVKVAPEGASAFWIHQPKGKTRYLDIGSRTVNCATVVHTNDTVRFIDAESDTIYKGIETFHNGFDPRGLADFIGGRLLSMWNSDDSVYLLGGGALIPEIVEGIKEFFPNLRVIEQPQYANAIGMYSLARNVFTMA